MINIERPEDRIPQDTFSLFALGFRPFFMLGAGLSIVLISSWLLYLLGYISLADHFAPLQWHAHEMIFGYAAAIITGFLLAAVRNWTSMETPTGTPLIVLTLIWLAGRLVCTLPLGLPPLLITITDLLFLPAVMLALAGPLIKARKFRNMAFLLILAMLELANLLMHLDALGLQNTGSQGVNLGFGLIILVIVVMGGRVIPMFTRTPLPGMKLRQWPWVEFCAVTGVVLLLLAELVGGDLLTLPLAILSLLVGAIHLLRLAGWYDSRIWQRPIIWVLHIAYGSIGIGFCLKGAALLGWVPASSAIHAFAYGGIGLITLGMMSRVSLGHTGRMLELPKLTVLGIKLLGVGTLVRIAATLVPGQMGTALLVASAILWVLAFSAFLRDYAPMLIRPRIDGRPG
ncbi:MAG: NnrS family protein [Motiliproteus sp.]